MTCRSSQLPFWGKGTKICSFPATDKSDRQNYPDITLITYLNRCFLRHCLVLHAVSKPSAEIDPKSDRTIQVGYDRHSQSGIAVEQECTIHGGSPSICFEYSMHSLRNAQVQILGDMELAPDRLIAVQGYNACVR